ncbi:hypothetical protein HZH68_015194 [Vespula germanica]|uniref:Uncharacterized protein n=1 Tax=Vespula germanica TaxID=30212 RepID=A0A834MSY4_VESGE|nr:hypothetical protein HZH68_015194 [Vespula germanica]
MSECGLATLILLHGKSDSVPRGISGSRSISQEHFFQIYKTGKEVPIKSEICPWLVGEIEYFMKKKMSMIYLGDEDLEYRIVSTQLSKGNNYEEGKQQREPSVPNDHGTNRPFLSSKYFF